MDEFDTEIVSCSENEVACARECAESTLRKVDREIQKLKSAELMKRFGTMTFEEYLEVSTGQSVKCLRARDRGVYDPT